MVIYVIGALICFAVSYQVLFVKRNPNQSRNLFGLVAVFLGLICIIDLLSQIAGPTELSARTQYIPPILYPFTVFIMMLIPMSIYKPIKRGEILKIMALPALIGIFSVICGCIIRAEEASFQGIHFVRLIYNTDIYSIWLLLNLLPLIAMYYFFYKMFKSTKLKKNRGIRKRLKIFLFAMTILIVVCYAFAIAEALLGTPPVSSVGNAVGISLAMLAFKLRKEKI